MLFQLDPSHVGFPHPKLAEPNGLIAFGGAMTPEWLAEAYASGIFPWYDVDGTPFWYAPDPRMVLFPKEFHLSKTMRRTLNSGRFETRIDTCFQEVMTRCASVPRPDQDDDSWITKLFIDSFTKLHEEGLAHSFETYLDGDLVGGLFGVSISDYFCGDSMFHEATDASKVAFARLVDFARMHGFRFIDAQLYTDHLASLGAHEISRDEFMKMLDEQDFRKTYRGRWRNNTAVLLIGGNEGDRVTNMVRCVSEIAARIGTVSLMSPLYETEPWGFLSDDKFLNQALVVDTDLGALDVLEQALHIESILGRIREGKERYSSRPIDIDIIFYNNLIVDTPRLQLPHPRMHLRRFVLEPLAKIIPDYIHPKFHKTMTELLSECEDNSAGNVRIFDFK